MRILLNTTTLCKGGALQTSTSFIRHAIDDRTIEWRFVMSASVALELRRFGIEPPTNSVVFDVSPSQSRSARKQLVEVEREVNPDCVFTFSGPAYAKFRSFHLLGCSEPYVTHPNWAAYRCIPFPFGWLNSGLRSIYKRWWMRAADAWVMQTEVSRRGLHVRTGVPLDRIAVVANTCGSHYLGHQECRPFPMPGRRVRMLCFTAPYRHKNLEFIPRVAAALRRIRPELNFEFVLTLPEQSPIFHSVWKLAESVGVADRLINVGPIPVSDGPRLYASCDAVFLPTLLETFSATYPEAMAMGCPILTSDLDFARDVCGDAAIYFSPFQPESAAERVAELFSNHSEWRRLLEAGRRRLEIFPTAQERYQAFIDVIRRFVVLGKRSALASNSKSLIKSNGSAHLRPVADCNNGA